MSGRTTGDGWRVAAIDHLHRRAMELAEAGELARLSGGESPCLLRDAFILEREAASLCAPGIEPTRSVLHKSAAALALDCREFHEAERLIAVALSGTPPVEIAQELLGLLERIGTATRQ